MYVVLLAPHDTCSDIVVHHKMMLSSLLMYTPLIQSIPVEARIAQGKWEHPGDIAISAHACLVDISKR